MADTRPTERVVLPPIPYGAWSAARQTLIDNARLTNFAAFDDAFAAAWPHLYAAALRHAADRALDEQERWGADPLDVHLRRWADEATP